MQRRSFLALGVGALAGCAGLTPAGSPSPADDAPLVRDGPGEYPHAIRLDNGGDRPASVALAVERDGSTLYEETHRIDAGSDAVVAGFTTEALPPERRYVTVVAETARDGEASAGVSVTACLGDVVVAVAPDGEPTVTYEIC